MPQLQRSQTKVVVVDDQPLFREGVAAVLGAARAFTVVGRGATADEAIALCQTMRPGTLLLDVLIPGCGFRAARTVKQQWPPMKVVFLTMADDHISIAEAVACGATGYLLKGCSTFELLTALAAIDRGETYITPLLVARMLARFDQKSAAPAAQESTRQTVPPVAALTARETEVLEFVSRGLTNKEVAMKLDLSEKTVKQYVTSILAKSNVRNRVELALFARGLAADRKATQGDEALPDSGRRVTRQPPKAGAG